MDRSKILIGRLTVFMWVASALLFGLTIYGSVIDNRAILKAALVLMGVFALVGILFGIWASRTINRRVDR